MTLLIIVTTAAITAVVLAWALKQKNDAIASAIDARTAQLDAMAADLERRERAVSEKMGKWIAERGDWAQEVEGAKARAGGLERQLQAARNAVARAVSERQAAEAKLALVDRYGADQWRHGNAGRDPQEFDEWQRQLDAWRQSERAAWQSEVQP